MTDRGRRDNPKTYHGDKEQNKRGDNSNKFKDDKQGDNSQTNQGDKEHNKRGDNSKCDKRGDNSRAYQDNREQNKKGDNSEEIKIGKRGDNSQTYLGDKEHNKRGDNSNKFKDDKQGDNSQTNQGDKEHNKRGDNSKCDKRGDNSRAYQDNREQNKKGDNSEDIKNGKRGDNSQTYLGDKEHNKRGDNSKYDKRGDNSRLFADNKGDKSEAISQQTRRQFRGRAAPAEPQPERFAGRKTSFAPRTSTTEGNATHRRTSSTGHGEGAAHSVTGVIGVVHGGAAKRVAPSERVQNKLGATHEDRVRVRRGDHSVVREEANNGKHASISSVTNLNRSVGSAETNDEYENRRFATVGRLPTGTEEIGSAEADDPSTSGDNRGDTQGYIFSQKPIAEAGVDDDVARGSTMLRRVGPQSRRNFDERPYCTDWGPLGRHEVRPFPPRETHRNGYGSVDVESFKGSDEKIEGLRPTIQRPLLQDNRQIVEKSKSEPHPSLPKARSGAPSQQQEGTVGTDPDDHATRHGGRSHPLLAERRSATGRADDSAIEAPAPKRLKFVHEAPIPQALKIPKYPRSYDHDPIPVYNKEGPSDDLPADSEQTFIQTILEDSQSPSEDAGLLSLYDNSLCVRSSATNIRPPAEARAGGTDQDYIAAISRGRICLDTLESLDKENELEDILQIIRKRETFVSHLKEGWDKQAGIRRGTSRHMAQHLDTLIDFGVLSRTSAPQEVILHAFTVEKKSGGLRFVVDGRKLNRSMGPPPQMRLPHITAVIHRIVNSNWVVLSDARSWFYQIEVDQSIRPFFGVNTAGERGQFTRTVLNCLAMGWSFAPAIAQRCSRVLLPEEFGICWIDNFIVIQQSREEAVAQFSSFCERCDKANVELNMDDPTYGTPTQQFCVFGVEFNLEKHTFRSEPAWLEKFVQKDELAALRTGKLTPRQFYVVFGCIVWHSYTTHTPLCTLPAAITFVQNLASKTLQNVLLWDIHVEVPPSVIFEVRKRISLMTTNSWILQPPTKAITVWSDASKAEWAAILEDDEDEKVAQGTFGAGHEETSIFLKELYAAAKSVLLAAKYTSACTVHMKVDNLSAVFCIERGHSSNFAANAILSEMFAAAKQNGMTLRCAHVGTKQQRADRFTRGDKAKTNEQLQAITSLFESAARPY